MTETFRSQRPHPCNGCLDRYPACSDHCKKPEYLAHKAEQELIRKNRAAYSQPVWASNEVDKGNYRKHQRRR